MFRLSSYTVCVFVCDRMLQEYMSQPDQFNINCVDPLNRSALIAAIENENIDLIRLLLDNNIKVKVRSTENLVGLLQQLHQFYMNCVDPLNCSSLIAAIENEKINLIRNRPLLDSNIKVRSTKSLAGLLQQRNQFTINVVDPLKLNHSALTVAIENENIDLIRLLLDNDVKVKVRSTRT